MHQSVEAGYICSGMFIMLPWGSCVGNTWEVCGLVTRESSNNYVLYEEKTELSFVCRQWSTLEMLVWNGSICPSIINQQCETEAFGLEEIINDIGRKFKLVTSLKEVNRAMVRIAITKIPQPRCLLVKEHISRIWGLLQGRCKSTMIRIARESHHDWAQH